MSSNNSVIPASVINPPALLSLDKKHDFDTVRTNIHDNVNLAQDAFQAAVQVAMSIQTPESFDAVTKLLKALTDANKALMDIQVTQKHLNIEKESGPTSVTNNLVVGSTEDILKMLAGKKDA